MAFVKTAHGNGDRALKAWHWLQPFPSKGQKWSNSITLCCCQREDTCYQEADLSLFYVVVGSNNTLWDCSSLSFGALKVVLERLEGVECFEWLLSTKDNKGKGKTIVKHAKTTKQVKVNHHLLASFHFSCKILYIVRYNFFEIFWSICILNLFVKFLKKL